MDRLERENAFVAHGQVGKKQERFNVSFARRSALYRKYKDGSLSETWMVEFSDQG